MHQTHPVQILVRCGIRVPVRFHRVVLVVIHDVRDKRGAEHLLASRTARGLGGRRTETAGRLWCSIGGAVNIEGVGVARTDPPSSTIVVGSMRWTWPSDDVADTARLLEFECDGAARSMLGHRGVDAQRGSGGALNPVEQIVGRSR